MTWLTVQSWLNDYGYLGLLIGTMLEGEIVLILGAMAAQFGLFDLPLVILTACAGTLFGDQLCFQLGRRHGTAILRRRSRWRLSTRRLFRHMHRHHVLLILGFRFLYGLRTAALLMFGMSTVSTARFLVLSGIGAALWASVVGGAGYLFGEAWELAAGGIGHYELGALAAAVFLGSSLWTMQRWRRRAARSIADDSRSS